MNELTDNDLYLGAIERYLRDYSNPVFCSHAAEDEDTLYALWVREMTDSKADIG